MKMNSSRREKEEETVNVKENGAGRKQYLIKLFRDESVDKQQE